MRSPFVTLPTLEEAQRHKAKLMTQGLLYEFIAWLNCASATSEYCQISLSPTRELGLEGFIRLLAAQGYRWAFLLPRANHEDVRDFTPDDLCVFVACPDSSRFNLERLPNLLPAPPQ